MRVLLRLCAAAAALAGSVASAQAQATLPTGPGSDEGIRRHIGLALANIHRARCGSGSCAPATPAELANPPISIAEARGVMRRGVLSGAGEHCGLDWQGQNFMPMMAYWRRQKKTDRQLALITLLHGMAQGQAKSMVGSRPCTEQARQNLQAQLAFRP